MVKLLKKSIGKLIKSVILCIAIPLSLLITIIKYAISIAENNKVIIDRLALKGGQKKRNKKVRK